MAIADVQTWLSSTRNFAAGIVLLQEHGSPSSVLLGLFERGETGYSRDRLAEALQVIANRAIAIQQGHKTPSRPHPAMQAEAVITAMSPDMDDWPMSRYPVELQELKRETVQWMREYDSLHGELRRIPVKDERYLTALRCKELDDMIHGAHYRLDTFRKTGTDIGRVEEMRKTRAELVLERNNLRTYISRITKGTRKASTEQLFNFKSRLALLQTAIDAGE